MHFRLPLILLASMLEKIVSISLVNTLSFGVPQRMVAILLTFCLWGLVWLNSLRSSVRRLVLPSVASRIPSSYLYKI